MTEKTNTDRAALWAGIAFSLLFTLLIWWTGDFLDTSNFLPDQGASWYFWKRPDPTFWYHPMESTSGHLIGFFYMFLLILQGSLLYTRVHTNTFWTTFLEAFVTLHGTLVAIYQGNGLWPMFFFGFLGVFVLTQMHGLKVPKWVHWLILGGYSVGVVIVYSQRGLGKLYELVSIPLIEYAGVLVAALLVWFILWVIGQKTPLFQSGKKE